MVDQLSRDECRMINNLSMSIGKRVHFHVEKRAKPRRTNVTMAPGRSVGPNPNSTGAKKTQNDDPHCRTWGDFNPGTES